MRKILIVEDNADLALGLRNNLEIEGYAVIVAHDGVMGMAAWRDQAPDLVVLDLMLPVMDGYRVLREMRARGSNTPVLLLTAKSEEVDKVRGLRLGADDYVTKPFGVLEVLARIEALLRRTRPEARVYRFGDVEVDVGRRTVARDGAPVTLTPMEFDLLLALLKRNGAVATRLDLLREVWGHSAAVLTRTVDTHVAELRRKLERDPASPAFILTARKAGYRLNQ
jgi:two-component system alkaline phosphatase synthesis response regulator PhoP